MNLELDRQDWYAARVRVRHELQVEELLRFKGYETFVPLMTERRRWTDRIKNVEKPMFPGYVFLQAGGALGGPVLTTPGVIHLVGSGRTPLAVDDAEIEAVRRIADSRSAGRPWPYLRVGQRVEIVSGPLAGLEGVLAEDAGDRRVVVSVSLLQRSLAVKIEADWVIAAGAAPRASELSKLEWAPGRIG